MMTTEAPTASLGGKLAHRLPRVMVPYIGGTWGVVQCLDWSANRYLLSPFLVDLAIYTAVLLIPAVLLLAYHRGEHMPWTRAEKVGIPLNVLAAATILAITFHGKELGAVTKQVQLTNAAGQTVERQVPKSAFRKHVALFFFANRSGDAQLDWLGQGLTMLLDADLCQDLFVNSKTQDDFVERIKKASLPPREALPMALQQEIARDAHLDYIVSGELSRSGADYVINVLLAPTSKGKPIADRQYRGADPLRLIDELSTQLRKDLGIPSSHVDDAPDLPVSEISTHSLTAMRDYVVGIDAMEIDNDARASIAALEQAVKEDPTFAQAWLALFDVLFQDNQEHKATQALAAAKRNEYRLAERKRLEFESFNAILSKDPEKELAILRQWVTLYPEDDRAHQRLAEAYMRRNRLDDGVGEYELLLKLDSNPSYLLQSGFARKRKGDYAAALRDYREYEARSPGDPKGYLKAAQVEELMGRPEQAKASFEKALAIEPDQIEALVGVSRVEMRLGQLLRAQETVDRALKQSPPAVDLARVLKQQADLFELQGKRAQALEPIRRMWDVLREHESTSELLRDQLDQMDSLVEAGKADEALAIIRNAEKASDNVNVSFGVQMAFAVLYVRLGDPARAAAAVDQIEKMMKTYEVGQLEPWVWWRRGEIDELNGAYASAAGRFQLALKAMPSEPLLLVELARCQRRQKKLAEARAALAQALAAYPSLPQAHAELARVFVDEGDKAKARAEVAQALQVWAQADAGYKDAAEARELAAQVAR
jgi:tetratricopeptide (TPR) repeat protein